MNPTPLITAVICHLLLAQVAHSQQKAVNTLPPRPERPPEITPIDPDPEKVQVFFDLEPEQRVEEAERRMAALEQLEPDPRLEVIGPVIDELFTLTRSPIHYVEDWSGYTVEDRVANALQWAGLHARLLGIAESLRPPRDLIDPFLYQAYFNEHADPTKDPDFFNTTSSKTDIDLVFPPDKRERAHELYWRAYFRNDMRWIDRSFHELEQWQSAYVEAQITRLSNMRDLSRPDFYQARLAILEVVVEHHPDEDLVKRLFPTAVVPPSLTAEFEGREQIEEREAALMERLEVESAKRADERAARLEPMIELWDQARREAAAGDPRGGGGSE